MDIRLPIPKNWQDFESICHRLWTEIWNDLNAQKNGRQGQAQHGVDIFGKPIYTSNYHGVQCKDKDNRLGSILTETELVKECNNAIDFKPSLSTFTLATTSQRDEGIQEFYRNLNEGKKFSFDINVWSWDDIEAEIAYRPMILNHYYPNIGYPETNLMNIKLNRHSTKDHLYAFFSRPFLKESISKTFKSYLMPLLYELTDNSYNYGKATVFEIKIEDNKIKLIDNGVSFDPIKELNSEKTTSKGNVGSFVFHTFMKKFKDRGTVAYKRENDLNNLEFTFDKDVFHIDDNNHFEIDIDLREAYGRASARNLASNIPTDKNEIIININEVRNLSVAVGFVEEALNRMTEEQTLTLSIPRHEYLSEMSNWFNDKRLIIKTR